MRIKSKRRRCEENGELKTKNLAIEFFIVVLCCHGDLLFTILFDSFSVSLPSGQAGSDKEEVRRVLASGNIKTTSF